jgi:hypothetical protein
MFREYIVAGYENKLDLCYTKMGVLVYIAAISYLVGVGVIGIVTGAVAMLAALGLLIYDFKHQIAEKLGLSISVPKLENI